ncbi:MAG: hypothetical protein K6A80_04100 [Saccharofermentans sp.]|nr:hypothetical protein [Saccharofermentans sp.]
MKNDNTIFVTVNKLMDFARFATDWSDIASDCDADPMSDCEFEGTYALTLDDVKEALEFVRNEKVPVQRFLMDWWYPLILKCDKALMIYDIFTSISASSTIEPTLPMTDDDMLVYVLDELSDFCSNTDLKPNDLPLSEIYDLDLLLEEIEIFQEDKDKPVAARRFSERMRERFIMQLDNDILLSDSDEGTKRLWKQFTDELADMGNFNAMRIKAYACYGGNSVYECDWKESERLLNILWKDYSFGQAANTLGFIHYNGWVSPDGKPDYEKAFFFFSIGSTYGIVESKYMLSDMFVNGYYVARNVHLARSMIGELYGDERFKFENGDFSCSFADVAYRMGRLFKDISGYEIDPAAQKGALEVASLYLLQADFAIKKKMETDYSFGDDKVSIKIERLMERIRPSVPHAKGNVYHSYNPIYVSLFADSRPGTTYSLESKLNRNGTIKFTLKRNHPYNQPSQKTLVTFPWFDDCILTDKIDFTLADICEVNKSPVFDDRDVTGYWSRITSVTTSESDIDDLFNVTFYCDNTVILEVCAAEVIYRPLISRKKKKKE